MTFKYVSGEEILTGDRILYGGHPGRLDWYLDPDGNGGFMIQVETFGQIFMSSADEDLQFVGRSEAPA